MNIQSAIFKTMRLGAICMLALGASAHTQNGEFMINNNAPNDWSRWSYVDFATSSCAAWTTPCSRTTTSRASIAESAQTVADTRANESPFTQPFLWTSRRGHDG